MDMQMRVTLSLLLKKNGHGRAAGTRSDIESASVTYIEKTVEDITDPANWPEKMIDMLVKRWHFKISSEAHVFPL